MWKCKKCSEVCEDTFDSCWKCGTERDDAPPSAPPIPEVTKPQQTAAPKKSLSAEITSLFPKRKEAASSETKTERSPVFDGQLNRIVKIQLTSFGNFAMDAAALLSKAIEKENAGGWRVIQIIADDKSDETLSNQILHIITLGFYKKKNGYILVLGK